MNIAIIGHGNVGRALARSLSRAGSRVVVAGRDTERTLAVAGELGVAGARVRDAAAGADVVILAIPFTSVESVAREIADLVDGRIVVDVTNAGKPDYSGPLFDGSSAAQQIATWLPGARVVKAFNTLFASNMSEPVVDGVRLDGYVAADDETARRTVLELVGSIGLEAVDAGPLSAARYLEAMAWLNISLNMRGGSWRSGWKLVGAPSATPAEPVAA